MSHDVVEAHRVTLWAPVASFRDPMFPGVTRCLPVPPPATVRGMLAAASGRVSEPVTLGMATHAEGRGVDAETYHPISADGSNPAVAGRVGEGKGGMTIHDRPFLADVHLTLWLPGPDGQRLAAALRRPMWPLRLGRSQDLVHILDIRPTRLRATDRAVIGHALAPTRAHDAPMAQVLRLADHISSDRRDTRFTTYLWCGGDTGPLDERPVTGGALSDRGQAVWLNPV